MDCRKVFIGLSIRHNGDWDKINRSITVLKDYDDEEVIDQMISNLKCGIITIMDENYPDYLNKICKPPFVLYYYGNINLINDNRNNLAVVGTREPSDFGANVTRDIIKGLKKEIVVVSGLASGIDGIAHEAALDNGHNTIAVLGSGINICFPSINRELYERIYKNKKSLIISEYPPGTPPTMYQFPIRNRIIAGLSSRVLVTEAKLRSGSSVTMSYALDNGKDVLCVPSSDLTNSACNLCIKDGGYLVESSEDVNSFFDDRSYYRN